MVNEKDVMRKLKYFAGIAAALMLWGCSEDKFVPDQYLNGLGGDEYVLNEIDEWIIDNYTRPYNMEVKYRGLSDRTNSDGTAQSFFLLQLHPK